MATTWIPRTTFTTRQHWLLANGDIIPEPDLEETTTGTKVRLPNDQTTSRYKKRVNEVIQEGLRREANRRKTTVWMPMDPDEKLLDAAVGDRPTQAEFDILSTSGGRKAVAWWKFQHPTLPIASVVVAELRREFNRMTVEVRLVHPDTQPNLTHRRHYCQERSDNFQATYMRLPYSQDARFESFVKDTSDRWAEKILTAKETGLDRPIVKQFYLSVAGMMTLGEIAIPDLRDLSEKTWLTLPLHSTNVSGQFVADIRDFLDGEDAMEEVSTAYADLVLALRRVGLILPDSLKENEFATALARGDSGALLVTLGSALNDDLTTDRQHSVAVHLPTGSFVVACSKTADKDKVAHAWNEAVFLADMTGKEDELLAYARRYAAEDLKSRAKKIIQTRTNQLNIN